MKKLLKCNGTFKLIITAFLSLFLAAPVMAFELRCQDDIFLEADETISEDLIAIAEGIDIKGEIKGDCIAAARKMYFSGIIEDDITAIAQSITLEGEVGDSFRAAGKTITVNARIKGDITAFGESVTLRDDCIAEGDVVIAGGELQIDGKVMKSLKAYGGKIKIRGEIAEDATLKGDRIVLYPGAKIRGNLTYTCADQIELMDDAKVSGETTWHKPVIKPKKKTFGAKNYRSRVIVRSLLMLPVLLIGLISIGISPRQVFITMDSMHDSPGKTLGFGFVFLICVPVATTMLFATIVGIPLALIVLLIYFAALYVSSLFAGMAIATKVFGMRGKSGRGVLTIGMILGVAIGVLLSTIPVAGGFIKLLLIIFGLGGLVMGRLRTFAAAREKELI
jgi:hypothetical protein